MATNPYEAKLLADAPVDPQDQPKSPLERIVFIKSWLYFVVALSIGGVAELISSIPLQFVLAGISFGFVIAGLVYYTGALAKYYSGKRRYWGHLACGTGLIIIYALSVILIKILRFHFSNDA